MGKYSENSTKVFSLSLKGAVLVGLYLSSLYNFLLFHSLVEIFSIVIGYSIFILVWNSRSLLDNDYLVFLGVSCLFVCSLDLTHMLAYKGMGVFQDYGANLPTQLWVAARYLQSTSILMSFMFLNRKLQTPILIKTYLFVTAALLYLIFAGIFPDCLVEGEGLTPFKKISEGVISIVIFAAIIMLIRKKEYFSKKILRWMFVSFALIIGSEIAFIYYVSVYGLPNFIGHIFKLGAFYFLQIAIVETGIKQPHQILFRSLSENEKFLAKSLAEVQKLARIDPLTGLYNRRHFSELAEKELYKSLRHREELSLILFDVDHFKIANDNYGHATGDQVLQWIAECCRDELRTSDIVGRHGGDEFVILLPRCDFSAARQVGERLRLRIAQKKLEASPRVFTVTISMGITSLVHDEPATLDALLHYADKALYSAKRSGRNRVESLLKERTSSFPLLD